MTIQKLIDKQDRSEIIRDQIGYILKLEETSQRALAVTAGRDPEDWRLRIFMERSNVWELLDGSDLSPIVNIWYEGLSFNPRASNVVERQQATGTFNIDIYGYGESKADQNDGHIPGDREASLKCQHAVKLVRNIIMSSEYTYLKLRGAVWFRMISDITIYQPQQDDANASQIVAARVSLKVDFSELSPQHEGLILELISTDIIRDPDGQLLFEADYEYTSNTRLKSS